VSANNTTNISDRFLCVERFIVTIIYYIVNKISRAMNGSLCNARESVFGVWRATIFSLGDLFFSPTGGGSGAKHVLSSSSSRIRGKKCVVAVFARCECIYDLVLCVYFFASIVFVLQMWTTSTVAEHCAS